jgi:hypothetical protein
MAAACRVCGWQEHCNPDCPTLYWPDGKRRGDNPGPRPVKRAPTLQQELDGIFAGLGIELEVAPEVPAD